MFLLYSRFLHFFKVLQDFNNSYFFLFWVGQRITRLGVSSANLGATVLSMDPQIVSLAAAKMATTNDKMHDG